MRATVVHAAILGVLAILVLPGGLAQDPQAPVAPDRLDLRLLGSDAAWRIEPLGDHARMTLASASAPAVVTMDVSGAPIFSLEVASIHGASIVASVDDVELRTIGSIGIVELPLGDGAHVLTLMARSTATDAAATLDVWGARTLAPPRLVQVPPWLYGCVLPTLDIVLDSVVPLAGFGATVDGIPANGTLERHAEGPLVRSTLHLALPPRTPTDHFVPASVELVVRDVTHRTWSIPLPYVQLMVIRDFGATPSLWAYALRPEIALVTSFCGPADIASVQFTLDGVDRTRDLASAGPRALPLFPFTEDLPFEAAHTYAFDLTLADGTGAHVGGAFREGLDSLDREMGPGALAFALTTYGGTYAARDLLGKGVPIQSAVSGLPAMTTALALPAGAHLHALYAPRALQCVGAPLKTPCAPYGGNAPGFVGRAMLAATLTVTTPDGETTIPGAGQFAAADPR